MHETFITILFKTVKTGGSPGGSVDKNPAANAGDMDLIPGPGGSHMLRAAKPVHRNYWASAPEPASCNAEPECCTCSSPCTWSLCSTARETTAVRSPCTAMKSSPCSPQLEKACTAMKTQFNQKTLVKKL